jgi:hypothetical protein
MNPEELKNINNANFAATGGNPNANYGTAPITSATLNPGASLNYKTPPPDNIYPVAGLDATMPELEMTEPEKQADDFTTK